MADAEDDQDDGEYDPASTAKRVTATANSATGSSGHVHNLLRWPGRQALQLVVAKRGRFRLGSSNKRQRAQLSSREQLRKANHSLIEKRRREDQRSTAGLTGYGPESQRTR